MQRILLIDDDPLVLRDASRALSKANYHVIEASGPLEGLRLAQSEHPDLILLDIIMPTMDGICVLRKLREDRATKHVPVIMLSSLDSEDQVTGCLDEGATDHIAKPFSHRLLTSRISACLLQQKLDACATQLEEEDQANDISTKGSIIGFVGVKGGVGATTLAANIAATLATHHDESVLLCEMRTSNGSLAYHLSANPRYRITDLLNVRGGLSPIELDEVLVSDSSGVRILFGPPLGIELVDLKTDQIEQLFAKFREKAEVTCLDLDAGLSATSIEILKLCDRVVLVLDSEPVSMAAGKAIVDRLQHLVVPRAIRATLIRRTPLALSFNFESVTEELGCDFLGVVPPCADELAQAVKTGATLVSLQPEADASQAIQQICQNHLIKKALASS